MAERTFKYFTTPDLIKRVTALGALLASSSGATKGIRNSNTGYLVETSPLHEDELKQKFLNGRYEIWLRGQGVDGKAAEAQCLALETCDPRREKTMRIHTDFGSRAGCGHF